MMRPASRTRRSSCSALLALTLSLALALGTLAASLAIDALRDHDCHGDDCVACHVIGMATALLGAHAAQCGRTGLAGLCLPLCAAALLVWRLVRTAETPVTE